ncbi:MAG: serine/threonine protein kinase [Bacteroidia bacterium]
MKLPALGKYEILQILGEGGMGIVYLAEQKPLGRKVAIKAISPYLAMDQEIRQRFADEAAVLARLSHPNIVTLYDYVEDEQGLYLIMEYVEGQSLANLLGNGPLPITKVYRYFKQILEAFQYAHDKGVIHRDIKPANILISQEDQVKVLDFGVAKLLSTEHTRTRTGVRPGTLVYMSPEQVRGQKIDVRSDIYSLGVVLYEMAFAKPPYNYPALSEFDLSLKIVQEPLIDISSPPKAVPQELLSVILQATEKNPEHRFADCRNFLASFERVFAREGPPTLPTMPINIPAPSPEPKPTPIPWRLLGFLLVLVAGMGVAAWWFFRPVSPKVASVPVVQDTSKPVDTFDQVKELFVPDTHKPTVEVLPPPPQAPKKSIPPPKPSKKPSTPSAAPSPPPAPTSPTQSTPPNPHEVITIEVVDVKKQLTKLTATILIRNSSSTEWGDITLVLEFTNRAGEVKKQRILQVKQNLASHATLEIPVAQDDIVGRYHGLRASLQSAQPL